MYYVHIYILHLHVNSLTSNQSIQHNDIVCIFYIIWYIPKHIIYRYDIFVIQIQHVQSRKTLAPQVRTNMGLLWRFYTPSICYCYTGGKWININKKNYQFYIILVMLNCVLYETLLGTNTSTSDSQLITHPNLPFSK